MINYLNSTFQINTISISLFQEQPEENLYLKKTFISLFKSKDMFLSNQ